MASFKEVKEILTKMVEELLEIEEKGKNPTNKWINDFYTIVIKHCDCGDAESENMYNLHTIFIKNIIDDSVKFLKTAAVNNLFNLLFRQINKINYIIFVLNKTFTYLERFYTKAKNKIPLNKKSFDLFKSSFFTPLQKDIFNALTELFKEIYEKDNEENSIKIKKCFKLISDIDNISEPIIVKENNEILWKNENDSILNNNNGIFDDWFNNYFIKEINLFFEIKLKDIQNLSIEEYIKLILPFDNQLIVFQKYFDSFYFNKISIIFNDALIKNKKAELENYFINLNKIELKKFYDSNKSSKSCLNFIGKIFLYSIEKNNLKIFENKDLKLLENQEKKPERNSPKFCTPIELKNQVDQFFSECFDNTDPEYRNLLYKICKILLNQKNKSYSKEIAYYIDYCMRIKFKGKSDEEINSELKQIVQALSLLIDKIEIKLHMEEKLSERLIKNSSLSLNTEKKLISMIKEEVGIYYTQKLVEMISDLDRSRKELEEYRKLNGNHCLNDIKFDVLIISQSSWIINNNNYKYIEKMKIPPLLNQLAEDFENIYKNRYDFRKLIWHNELSRIEIEYLCFENKKKYKSKSTLVQYLILLELEKFKKLSIKKIAENIECNVNLVLNDIIGLISNPSFNKDNQKDKGIILGNFTNENNEFKETDEFWINFNFDCPKLSINTLPLIIKKSKNEIKNEEEMNEKIKKNYQNNIIQARIVSIMKGLNGKSVQHQWLISEVSKQIDLFSAQPYEIKENIEKIIEKNIIKRDEKDKSCYQYIS